jgi:hypothetical protein
MNNDSKIIFEICEKHDTSLIDKLSRDGYNILKKIITNSNINKVKFKGLFYILLNKVNKKVNLKFDSYYGANTIIYMTSTKYDKYVYLIGETHKEYIPCNSKVKNISELVISNLRDTDKFIDVFLEKTVLTKEVPKQDKGIGFGTTNILRVIENDLSNCLILSKEKCEFYGARIHYADVRHLFFYNSDMKLLGFILVNIQNILALMAHNNKEYELRLKDLIGLLERHKDKFVEILKDAETIKQNLIIAFNTYNKYQKNLENLADSDIRKYLMKYLYNIIDGTELWPLIYGNLLMNLGEGTIDSMSNYFKIFDILVAFMDVYLISRLFRGYKQVKYQNSKSAKYSIIITGEFHTKSYIKILTDLGFELKMRRDIEKDGCIHNVPSTLFNLN